MNLPSMAGPAVAGFAPGRLASAVRPGWIGRDVASFTTGAAGPEADIPSGARNALDWIVIPAGARPALFAVTTICPACRVARIATRLIPASRSRNRLFTESTLPLL